MIAPRPILALALCTLVTSQRLNASTSQDPQWDSVQIAWDRGQYGDALGRMAILLVRADAERWLERAALLTGELFVTTELAPDGRSPRWSPGGRYAAWETGTGADRLTNIALVTAEGTAQRVAELRGGSLAFAPGDGFVAYVTTEGVVRDVALATLAERTIPTPGLRVRSLSYRGDGTLLARASPASDTTSAAYALGPDAPAAVAPPDTVGAWVAREGAEFVVYARTPGGPRLITRSPRPKANPVLSADGAMVAWQEMPREDWEIFVAATDGSAPRRLSHEIQHDIFPQFVAGGALLEVLGEGRHRRSYLLDVASGARRRLFHNNTVRTISSEYQWAVSPEGARILIVADRDGNTVSPERGLYLTDLTRRVGLDQLRERVRAMTEAERALRAAGEQAFMPFAPRVRSAVAEVSVPRIDRHAHDLAAFGSRFITQPGNRLAADYLAAQLTRFGYQPELQWFEPRPGVRSANIIATLRGTVDPDVVVVAGTHMDSVEPSPGADDNGSGTTALLEVARVLATRPQRLTIKFVWFTAEEAGLLGARHFARQAVADSMNVVAALNNDMIGWMNDHRLDNTIRYTNDGLRDIQHAAAFLFSDLITYDSRYYQSTDAQPMNDAWGDIVAGIGSYPVLGNPHYHQSHDVLETIDQRLVAEVSKVTIASLILMASSPSRLRGLEVAWNGEAATATWRRPSERGITGYRVRYGPPENPTARVIQVRTLSARLPGAEPGWRVSVKALLPGGVESWDWASTVVP